MLGGIVHDEPVQCNEQEYARFEASPGQTYQSYVQPFIDEAVGYLRTGSDGLCEFCQSANGDQFGRCFSVYYTYIWRELGILCGFILVVYLATWLRFKGTNPFKKPMMRSTQKKAGEVLALRVSYIKRTQRIGGFVLATVEREQR
jgi:ATP-binding cassette subfamily G (WHITE) protein 2 (SNQ2)